MPATGSSQRPVGPISTSAMKVINGDRNYRPQDLSFPGSALDAGFGVGQTIEVHESFRDWLATLSRSTPVRRDFDDRLWRPPRRDLSAAARRNLTWLFPTRTDRG